MTFVLAALGVLLLAMPAFAACPGTKPQYAPTTAQEFRDCLAIVVGGDTITLRAGTNYDTGGTSFELRNHGGTSSVTIRSSALANLPAGTRVTPAVAQHMPKLRGTATNVSPIRAVGNGAGYYKFHGIEFTHTTAQFQGALIDLGDRWAGNEKDLAHHFEFDRCYLHGNPSGDTQRGLGYNGSNLVLINSYFDDFKYIGVDAMAMAWIAGRGVGTIENNFMEGAGYSFITGGASTNIPNVQPNDLTIRRNHFYKRPQWNPTHPSYGGKLYSVKNTVELKSGDRITFEGNTFEGTWCANQQHSLVLTVRGSASNPWSSINDITIKNNLFLNHLNIFNMHGYDSEGPSGYKTFVDKSGLTCNGLSCTANGHGMTVGSPSGTYAIENTGAGKAPSVIYAMRVESVQSTSQFRLAGVAGQQGMTTNPNNTTYRLWSNPTASTNIRIENNLAIDTWSTDAPTSNVVGSCDRRVFQVRRSPINFTMVHNTIVSDQNLTSGGNPVGILLDRDVGSPAGWPAGANKATGFSVTNNILPYGALGSLWSIVGGTGTAALNEETTGGVFASNLSWGTYATPNGFPSGNYAEGAIGEIGFANPAGNTVNDWKITKPGDCNYQAGGACQASDKTAMGVDTAALLTALATPGVPPTEPPPIQPPATTVTLTANPASVPSGQTTTLTWTTTGTTACEASGGWTGKKATNGTEVSAPLTTTTTFTLRCEGGDPAGRLARATGSVADTETVSVTGTPPGAVAGTVAFNAATGNRTYSGGTSMSVAHTTAGSDRYLQVCAAAQPDTTVSTCTANGVALTRRDAYADSNVRMEFWDLRNPTAGSNNIVCTWSKSASFLYLIATSYTGVHQTTPLGPVVKGRNSWSPPRVSVPTAAGELVTSCLRPNNTPGTPAAPTTMRRSEGTDGIYVATTPSTAASATVSYPNTVTWHMMAAPVKPSAAAPPKPSAPTVSLSANPTTVASGASTTLTWTSKDATSCTASGGWTGTKTTQGSEVLANRTATATYTLGCDGAGGKGSANTTVTVTKPPPSTTWQCGVCKPPPGTCQGCKEVGGVWECTTCSTPPTSSWECDACKPPATGRGTKRR